MLILIAESKTMLEHELEINSAAYHDNCPSGEGDADIIMHRIAKLSVPSVMEKMKVSMPMASKVLRLAYEFPNKSIGLRTIEAFTGVVFKALDYNSLSSEAKDRLDCSVRLISSLYGWLRPDDIIKRYRFDFNTRLAPDDKTFAEFWRKRVTIQLVKFIQSTDKETILNLLPGDASRCIDWKLVKRFAKVWKVDFKELKDGGCWKTPNAGRLKQCRGELLREILERNITNPSELINLETDNLMPLGLPDFPDHIAFCV